MRFDILECGGNGQIFGILAQWFFGQGSQFPGEDEWFLPFRTSSSTFKFALPSPRPPQSLQTSSSSQSFDLFMDNYCYRPRNVKSTPLTGVSLDRYSSNNAIVCLPISSLFVVYEVPGLRRDIYQCSYPLPRSPLV